jgi:membrane peptidoglycan carboxypeptidase
MDCPRGIKPSRLLRPPSRRVLDPAHAYEMTNVLSDNNARCTFAVCEFGLNSPLLLDRVAAAKTGTTNAFTDNWTVGYTPQIVTGVWAGNADRSPMVNVIGVTGAAPIWHDFMEGAFHILRLPIKTFHTPPNVIESTQCTVPNTTSWQSTAPDLYVPGSGAPRPLCSIPERGFTPALCASTSPQYASGQTYAYATPQPCIYGGYPGNAASPYPGTTAYAPPGYANPVVPQQSTVQSAPTPYVPPTPLLPTPVLVPVPLPTPAPPPPTVTVVHPPTVPPPTAIATVNVPTAPPPVVTIPIVTLAPAVPIVTSTP